MTDRLATYPALMAYIADRNTIEKTRDWCTRLREDEQKAKAGEFADVAAEMQRAQADYAEQETKAGRDPFPYNQSMGLFLGLPINPGNHEPPHGYYMASCVSHHYRLGVALRTVQAAIAEGKELRIVLARSKRDRKPVRFARFTGEQIQIEGSAVTCRDGKRTVRLTSNWSVETTMEQVAEAMLTGCYYGEHRQHPMIKVAA